MWLSKNFKVLHTDSVSMKWSYLGRFWALTLTNMVQFYHNFHYRYNFHYSALANKKKVFWRNWVFMQKGRTQSLHFWSNFNSPFPPEDGSNRKNKHSLIKTSAIGLSNYFKIKDLSPLPFTGKIWFIFALFGHFWQETGWGHKSKGPKLALDIPYFTYTIPGQLPVKTFLFQHFPVLRL